jgi:uncharacterized membrane protein
MARQEIFFEAFAGDKKKFTQNVLANIDDNDVWRIGFITREDMSDFGLIDFVSVYVPMAYSVAGNVYIVPKNRVRAITQYSSTQTMKFAVSGGRYRFRGGKKSGQSAIVNRQLTIIIFLFTD